MLGWGAGFGILREIGPLLVALMISGRVGANNTAELGTMVVTAAVMLRLAIFITTYEWARAENSRPPYCFGIIMPKKRLSLMYFQMVEQCIYVMA